MVSFDSQALPTPTLGARTEEPTPPQQIAFQRLQVFLSHAAEDRPHVAIVQQQIEALGIDVYLAEHDVRPGTSIAEKVVEAIRRADVAVVLITTASINSAYVQQEVGLAHAFNKPIVPIVDSSIDPSRLGMLAEVEWLGLDLTRPAEALSRLTASLQPFVIDQLSAHLSSTQAQSTPDVTTAILLLGLGLLLGLLVASIAFDTTIVAT